MAAMNSFHLGKIQKVLTSVIFRNSISSKHYQVISRYSTESTEAAYRDKNEEELAKIEKKRNKSNMRAHYRIQMEANLEMPETKFDFQLHPKYKRKMYAKFGRASGIDPSIMWPTKQELQETIKFEKEFMLTLEEMVTYTTRRRIWREEYVKNRHKSVEDNMLNLDKWLEELKFRRDKNLAVLQAQKDKKEQLIEEVRQFFGYRLSPKDPKFLEVLEKKEKEEKKVAKDAKKQEKFAKEMARLASLAQGGTKREKNVENAPKQPPATDN